MLVLTLALPVCGLLALGASAWRWRRSRHQFALHARLVEERESRYSDHAVDLIAAARRSPAAVMACLEACAARISPAINAILFAQLEDDALVVRYARGMHAGFVQNMRLDPAGRCALAKALRLGHRVQTGTPGVEKMLGEGAYLAMPIISRGRALGAVAFLAACPIDLGDTDELVRLIEVATPAYEIAVERLADVTAATTDGLTGLYSPVSFRQRLAEEMAGAVRRQMSYALLFIDTDHFKSCNDTLGHAAGDTVLTSIAAILVQCGGPDALIARNGGDEFCLALPATKSAALRIAERIREAIERFPYAQVLRAKLVTSITASIGVAVYPDDATDASRLLEAADAAMYDSKRAGRNRVSCAGEEGSVLS
jgi:diguanylate cyclase (GGDEF)-like protein